MPEPAKPDVLQERLEVKVRGETYEFSIPSIRFDIEVGYRAAEIRRKADPAGGGTLYNLDSMAANLAANLAILELYLAAGPAWPFSAGPDGKPVVDHVKFPRNRTNTVWEVADAFRREFERFRDDGVGNGDATRQKAVDGSTNTGA